MNRYDVEKAFRKIRALVEANKEYLGELDARSGDGDLGISMSAGFAAVLKYMESSGETDLGKVFVNCSRSFNAEAPSSLGTILSLGMMGMAKALRGKTECGVGELADAMDQGLSAIMDKAKSKPGEKTILDALCPAIETMKEKKVSGDALEAAMRAAEAGAESTVMMRAVHGRAAYYGDGSIGHIDGGAVVGKLIFQGISAPDGCCGQ